jgi:hypothetical protein
MSDPAYILNFKLLQGSESWMVRPEIAGNNGSYIKPGDDD